MRVILNENQMKGLILKEFVDSKFGKQDNYDPIADNNPTHNPYSKIIQHYSKALGHFLHDNGKIMTNIINGKDYYIYEIAAFANIIGKRFCICQLIKDNKPFGAIYVKPYNLFKLKLR